MVLALDPLAGTRCSGVLGRIGIGTGDAWLALLDRSLVTSPGWVALPVVVVVSSLGGVRAATMIRSLMFPLMSMGVL